MKHVKGLLISAIVALVIWFPVASLEQLDIDWTRGGHRVGGIWHIIAIPFRALKWLLELPFFWSSPAHPANFHPFVNFSVYLIFWSPLFYLGYLALRRVRHTTV